MQIQKRIRSVDERSPHWHMWSANSASITSPSHWPSSRNQWKRLGADMEFLASAVPQLQHKCGGAYRQTKAFQTSNRVLFFVTENRFFLTFRHAASSEGKERKDGQKREKICPSFLSFSSDEAAWRNVRKNDFQFPNLVIVTKLSPLPEQNDDLRFCLPCEKCKW